MSIKFTVQQLIDELSKLDPHKDVLLFCPMIQEDDYCDVREVEDGSDFVILRP